MKLTLVWLVLLVGACALDGEVTRSRDGLDQGNAGQAAAQPETQGGAGRMSAQPQAGAGGAGAGGQGEDGDVQLGPEVVAGQNPELHPENGPAQPPVQPPLGITQCVRPANIISHGPFELALEWDWEGPVDAEPALPLVANLTDDNGDGVVDTSDTPDVAVKAMLGGFHVVLDGASGATHAMFPGHGSYGSFAALGDIDADGVIELVSHDEHNGIVAVDAQGAVLWRAPPLEPLTTGTGTISLADLDQDGSIETISDGLVLRADGERFALLTPEGHSLPPLAIELDGDHTALEFVSGTGALHADGTRYFAVDDIEMVAQVADLEFDGVPEVVLSGDHTLALLEHDGTPRRSIEIEIPEEVDDFSFGAATLAYIDGDAELDIAVMSRQHMSVYRSGDLSLMWRTPLTYSSYVFASTGFDFDGDGTTEIVVADETRLRVLDGNGGWEVAGYDLPGRRSIGYPTIADVDNDGSAEIVVSVRGEEGSASHVMVFGAPQGKSFMPARRIWNQYHYSVTNIEEDGGFRTPMPRHYMVNNTFRAQASILWPSSELCSVGTRANGEKRAEASAQFTYGPQWPALKWQLN